MEDKVIPTKLSVFNSGSKLSFDVNTHQFLKEACENTKGGMYAVCWNIFQNMIVQVAERAIELNDPVLNTLMIRLHLYEIPNKERYKVIKQMEELYQASIKENVKKANEAKSKFEFPDKLYARTKDNITLDVSYAPQTLDAVEYTQSDVFMERAKNWLKDCLDNGMWIADDVGCAEKEVIIEDFREYMEGE